MAQKRLFVAIDLPDALKNALEEAMNQSSAGNLRWTPAENLHITLVFIGDAPEEQIPELSQKIEEVAAVQPPFSLDYAGSKMIYRKKKPVMLWGVFDFPEAFSDLARSLHNSLNIEARHAPFPHVTLSRIKKPIDPYKLDLSPLQQIEFNSWQIKQLTLFESIRTKDRPYYYALDTFSLRGQG